MLTNAYILDSIHIFMEIREVEKDAIVKVRSNSLVILLDPETRQMLGINKGDRVHIHIRKA